MTIPINPNSISVTYLDKGTGGKGREEISFTTEGTLTNDLYSVTLLNTGPDAVRDIAGNVLASPVTEDFAIYVPSLSTTLFVGGASYVTNAGSAEGSRENPYPTIGAAMAAATAGDVVAVLPGVYTENVTLKQFVRLLLGRRVEHRHHGLYHQHWRPALDGHPGAVRQHEPQHGHRRRPPELLRPRDRDRRFHHRQPAAG